MQSSPSLKRGRTIAITGKGGVGKTVLAAMVIGLLARTGEFKILAIDADSAVSLPYALGMEVEKTVGEIRHKIIADPYVKAEISDKPMRTVIATALESGRGFDLLVMGRPEGPGCYCAINDLLRYGIETLSNKFDLTIIDGEAGPEQINRRVIQSVDTLIVVTDASTRGVRTAALIKKIAQDDRAVRFGRMGLVINRVKEENESIRELAEQIGIDILGYIPEDENITKYDSLGKPIIDLPNNSPSVLAAQRMLAEIGLLTS
jgi:CO dehydrogenase maturation factor